MYLKALGVVVSVFVAWYIFDVVSEPKCHQIPVIENFDFQKIKGIWYVYQTSSPTKKDRKCFIIAVNEDDKAQEIWLENNAKQTVNIKLTPGSEPSNIFVQWAQLDPKLLWVISGDYNRYMVLYLCWPIHKDGGIVFVWTRDEKADNETIQEIEQSLLGVGFTPTSPELHKIDHEECDGLNKIEVNNEL